MFWKKLAILTDLRVLFPKLTVLFQISIDKIPRKDIFGPKYKEFSFWTKICNLTNLCVLLWNMIIVFPNCSPKSPPKKTFLVPDFQFSGFSANKPFLVHNLKGFFVLHETLHLSMRKVVYMAFVLVSVCCCFSCDYFPTFFYSRRLFYNADLFLGIF